MHCRWSQPNGSGNGGHRQFSSLVSEKKQEQGKGTETGTGAGAGAGIRAVVGAEATKTVSQHWQAGRGM